MNKHYSEADLLETYYMQPGASMPVMMHLASCSDCAAKYERLERKLRDAAACSPSSVADKPDTFWSRQRLSIQRRIATPLQAGSPQTWRIAAATVLAFLLGGAVVYKSVEPRLQTQAPVIVATRTVPVVAPEAQGDELLTHDAWQSDELSDFHAVVQWESWETEKTGDNKSL